jgi:hypothetical protein
MKKSQKRSIGVIAILLMLGASPLSVTYSFADFGNYQEGKKEQQSNQKEGLSVILTEKIVDGKLKAQHYELHDDISEKDMQRMLSSDGEISSWAFVNIKAYHSGIILFDGKASKIGENLWKISTNGMLNLGERQFDLELNGKSNDSQMILNGAAALEGELSYKIIFSGKVSETDEENVFEIFFVNLVTKNPELGENIKFPQIEELIINSEKSIESNQEFKNMKLVR